MTKSSWILIAIVVFLIRIILRSPVTVKEKFKKNLGRVLANIFKFLLGQFNGSFSTESPFGTFNITSRNISRILIAHKIK